MPIPVISKLKPINNGEFPVVEDIDIQGGYQVRQTLEDLNNIPNANKKDGMLVYVVSESKYYTLSGGSWEQANLGGAVGTRFNNSPNTHVGNMFVGPTNGKGAVVLPENKILGTKIGAYTGKIIYDPTVEILDVVTPTPRRGLITQKGPYLWFIRIACNDIIKYDISTNDIFHINLEDVRKYFNKYDAYLNHFIIGDGYIDYNNQKFYALEFINRKLIKIDAVDLQIDRLIDLPDFPDFTLPIGFEVPINLLARFILFDESRNRNIIIPNLFLDNGINFWSVDNSDNASTHFAAFPEGPTVGSILYQIDKAIIADDHLWILSSNFRSWSTNLNLYKISLDTLQIVASYSIDLTETGYSVPDSVVGTKLIKHPTLPYIYILNGGNIIHKLDLENNSATYYYLPELLGTVTDMSYDVNNGCFVICENAPEIVKLFDVGGEVGFITEIYPIEPETFRKYNTNVSTIEYIPDYGSHILSDINNDMIVAVESTAESLYINNVLSVIGVAEWQVNNKQNVKIVNNSGLITNDYISPEDQLILVNNILNETGGFTTVNLYLESYYSEGTTITVKDISSISPGASSQPLIIINSYSGYIEPSSMNPYNTTVSIYQPLSSVTLTYDGGVWRIIGSYVPNSAIVLGTLY